MKKVWLLAIFAIITIFLTACGSSEKTDASKNEENTAANSEEQTTPAEPEVSDETKYAEGLKEDLKLLTEDQLELSQESYDFIVANYKFFPAKSKEDIAQVEENADSSITAKHLNKNAQPYFKKIATFQGSVISVEENPLENGETVSVTHVYDDAGQSYEVIMYKSTGDILEDDMVRFWGVPVGQYSFENVSGGSTNAQVFFGSHIEKVN